MYDKLRKIRQSRAEDDRGFTLIELLVVVVIIGILVAIAIPLYLHYKEGAEKRTAQSDTRNAVPTMEQCYADSGNDWTKVTQAAQASGGGIELTCDGTKEEINVSSGNTISVTLPSSGSNVYTVAVTNTDTGTTYTYSSGTGQVTKSS